MMRVDVEGLHPELLRRAQEGERIDGCARRSGSVVALRTGDTARHLLAWQRALARRDGHRVDTGVDRVADLRVLERALDPPRLPDALVLRREPERIVRLVPGRPHGDLRERRISDPKRGVLLPARRDPVTAVALRGRVSEVPQVERIRRSDSLRLTTVGPRRREEDGENDLNVVRRRVLDEPVIQRPIVGRISGIGRVGRLLVRDGPLVAAPVAVSYTHLRAHETDS